MTKIIDKTIKKQLQPKQLIGKGFQKGKSGNPAGRPAGRRNVQTLFDEAIIALAELGKTKGLKDVDIEKDIFKKILDKARSGDPHAMKLFMEYRVGKAKHQEDDKLVIELESGFTDEERELMKLAVKNAGLDKITKG